MTDGINASQPPGIQGAARRALALRVVLLVGATVAAASPDVVSVPTYFGNVLFLRTF